MPLQTFDPSIKETTLLLQNLLALKQQQKRATSTLTYPNDDGDDHDDNDDSDNDNDDNNNNSELPLELERLVSDYITAQKKFTDGIYNFMHRQEWREDEYKSTEVIIETCPEILGIPNVVIREKSPTIDYDNDYDDDFDDSDYEDDDAELRTEICRHLPIHTAANSPINSALYVPLLAEIGLEHGVGGKGGRGGLFVGVNNDNNNNNNIHRNVVIDLIKNDDAETIEVLIEKDMIFVDEPHFYYGNGGKCGLLHGAIAWGSFKITRTLVELDHSCLLSYVMMAGYGTVPMNPLAESCIHESSSNNMRITRYLLQKTLQYYPTHESVGGLFPVKLQSNGEGEGDRSSSTSLVALKFMVRTYGENLTWNVIEESLSSFTNIPILHKVIQYVPNQICNTIRRFPHSVFLLDDHNGSRLPIHVALDNGVQWSDGLISILHANMSHLKQKDPVTGFYPFVLAAAEPSCDLRTITYLLKLHPTLVQDCFPKGYLSSLSSNIRRSKKKHKRGRQRLCSKRKSKRKNVELIRI